MGLGKPPAEQLFLSDTCAMEWECRRFWTVSLLPHCPHCLWYNWNIFVYVLIVLLGSHTIVWYIWSLSQVSD